MLESGNRDFFQTENDDLLHWKVYEVCDPKLCEAMMREGYCNFGRTKEVI